MTVKELITALEKEDPEAELLIGDPTGWWHTVNEVSLGHCCDGRLLRRAPPDEKPAVLID